MLPILPMVEGLSKITEKLLVLVKYREEKSRRIFDKFIEPIFTDLLVIHKDYLEMFEGVQAMLPNENDSRKEIHKKLDEAVVYLQQKRTAFEPVRVKLRAIIEMLPENAEKDNKKDAFVRSVANYLRWSNRFQVAGSRASNIATEIRAAALRYSQPRSKLKQVVSAIMAPHAGALTAHDLAAYLSVTLDDLRTRFARASEAYAAILVEVRNE